MGACEGYSLVRPGAPKVAHNGLYTPQGAEKDYRNDIGPVNRGNIVKSIGTYLNVKCTV